MDRNQSSQRLAQTAVGGEGFGLNFFIAVELLKSTYLMISRWRLSITNLPFSSAASRRATLIFVSQLLNSRTTSPCSIICSQDEQRPTVYATCDWHPMRYSATAAGILISSGLAPGDSAIMTDRIPGGAPPERAPGGGVLPREPEREPERERPLRPILWIVVVQKVVMVKFGGVYNPPDFSGEWSTLHSTYR